MAIIKSFSPFQNLSNFQTFLVDDNPLSDYFRITEFKDTFTGGKNGFLIEGSEFLKETTEVKIELLDVEGNPIYFEPGDGIPEYYEGTSKLVSCHVYDDTPIGLGKITILGELKNYVNENGSVVEVPEEWKGVYNVKWERTFKVNKNLSNEDIVRFYKRPLVNIDELVKPIFTKSVNQVTDSESTVTGVSQLPNTGTNLSTYRGGTFYKLIKSSGSWDIDVDENTIDVTVDGLVYSPKIIEVLNDREVLVDIPYTENSIVGNFVSQSYSVTYTDFEHETIGESALTGSFAKIDITQLKTFVGDVARVKVFRKSRSSATDFQFVQESRLESTELLRDITTTENTELSYGRFDESNLSTYWITSSNDHPTEVDSSILSQAVKVDYNGSGVQQLITSQSFSISKDVEYTLNFRTLLSGSITDDKYLKAYFSGSYENGSPFTQSFVDVTPDGSYVVRKNITENVISQQDVDAKLVFEFKGDDWYISNVSLRNAQDTSFSPDEFTLIQDIPRKLASETFDFRFEFYDINNNYIPVNVIASKTFNGGNDFNTTSKLLTFESDRNAFRYISGSASPTSQQIQFKTTIQNLTGSIVYNSGAFDEDGNLIPDTDWTVYPGLLTNPSNNGGLVTVSSFEGTWGGVDPKPEVFSIIYTASIEELEEFETIYRLEDGENAPTLLVTSNANQFVYEPTVLAPKPAGQSITVRAHRKNLAAIDTPITVNKSDANGPDLTLVSTISGVDMYTVSALEFSSSFSANNFDEITYQFTGSDVYGVEYSDEITLSKVVNFDGVSIVISNEATTLTSDSRGFISSSDFELTSGSATVYVAGNLIPFDDNGVKNTFEITNLQGTNCTPNGGNGSDPILNEYGIAAISADKAALDITITYTAGDGATSQSFKKNVSYTRAKSAPPSFRLEVTNNKQTVEALSNGVQTGSFQDSVATVYEYYKGEETILPLNDLGVGSNAFPSPVRVDTNTGEIFFSDTTNWIYDSANVVVNAFITDSEGTNHEIREYVSLSKNKRNPPSLVVEIDNSSQTVPASSINVQSGSFENVTFRVIETYDGVETIFEGPNDGRISNAITYPFGGFNPSVSPMIGGWLTDRGAGLDDYTLPPESSSAVGHFAFDYEDLEGSTRRLGGSYSLSKVKNPSPTTTITLSPQTQTVTSSSLGVGSPIPVEVFVSEDNFEYTFTTSALGFDDSTNAHFRIEGASGGINVGDGTVAPLSPGISGGSGSIEVSYQNSDGAVITDRFVRFDVGVASAGESGESGSTGPGIVFRGPWSGSTSYQFDESNGRRDSVLYSDIYYVALQPSTDEQPTGTEDDNEYWQSLGTQDFFVAAKIAIFEDSYIQNTLNVGTNNNGLGDSANITINGGSTNPYISINQSASTGSQGYDVDGIFMGMDGGTEKLSIKSDENNYLRWTGAALEISGDLNLGGTLGDYIHQDGTFQLADGDLVYDGTTFNFSADLDLNASGESDGDFSTTGIYLSTSGWMSSPNFYIGSDGAVGISATLTAGTVKIGSNVSGGLDGLYIDANNYWLNGGTVPFQVGNGTNSFKIGSSGAIGVNVDTGGMQFYNTSGLTQGMSFSHNVINILPVGVGSGAPGYITFGAGTIQGNVTGGKLVITPTTVVDIQGDLDVSGAITADGNITAYASSDKRLKDNITPLTSPLIKISKLGGYEFDWNENQSDFKGHDVGVIAQEIQEVIPEVVTERKDGYLAVRYEKLVPLLIEGIKELTDRVEKLEEENKKLKEK